MFNLATNLERTAKVFPDKTAIIFAEETFTWSHLNQMANQVANGLVNAGIQPGDHIALTCPNLPYFPIIYFGILKAGAVVVPINILLKTFEIAYHLKDSNAKAYFCFQGTAEIHMGKMGYEAFIQEEGCESFYMITTDPSKPASIEGCDTLASLMQGQTTEATAIDTCETDTAVILYTSGTTGRPKGAELTHSNLAMNTLISQSIMHLTSGDTTLLTLPLFHSFGQVCQMNASILVGATMVLLPSFEPRAVFEAFIRHNVTIFAGVPTMYIGLLQSPDADDFDLALIAQHLRLAFSGGASMPVSVMDQFQKKFGITILEGYGLSETSPVASFNYLDTTRKIGSVGQPAYGIDIKIMDDQGNFCKAGEKGEVVIRGHNIMKGYYNRPEATKEAIINGWFHSGDIGKQDEDGALYIVDRLKDMIIRGGFNVYPREIEEVMMAHPAIAQVAVIGVPHDTLGEEIKAVIVLKPGQSETTETVKNWCKEHMANYKYPHIVEIVEKLPMTATGKILKREVR